MVYLPSKAVVLLCSVLWVRLHVYKHLDCTSGPAHGGTASANISGELEGGTRFKGCEMLTERVRMCRPGPAGRWAPGDDSSGENGIVCPRQGETMQRSRGRKGLSGLGTATGER